MILRFLLSGLLIVALATCRIPDGVIPDRVCVLSTASEVHINNGNSAEATETILYNLLGQPIEYQYRNAESSAKFQLRYQNRVITRAYNDNAAYEVLFEYDGDDRLTRATYLASSGDQTVFTTMYDGSDRLIRITEVVTLPRSNSSRSGRFFRFEYNDTNDIILQSVLNSFRGGTQSEEEWLFVLENPRKRGVFFEVSQRVALTILALTNPLETNPSRVIQAANPKSYRRNLVKDGVRSPLEIGTYQTTYNAFGGPERRQLDLTVYVNNLIKNQRYVQTFGYQCLE